MFTNEDFAKLTHTPGVGFSSLKNFMSDRRLTSPIGIVATHECGYSFGEFDVYPSELSEVFYNNGF
jgi:hypothetical protein